MTHTQTQGADGAGTLARFGHHPDPSTDFCIEVDALQGWAVDMRAGLRSQWPYWSRLSKLLRFVHSPEMAALDSIAQAALPAVSNLEGAAFDAPAHATPAPAATPGVPDSVRALLKEVISTLSNAQVVLDRAGKREKAVGSAQTNYREAQRCADTLANVRALIAAQPAGQSADFPATDLRHMLECEKAHAKRWMDRCHEAERKLREAAPNSTRTGAAETEEAVEAAASEREALRKAVSNALHDNQFLDGWPEMVDPVVEAVLAARPEAPSDAGGLATVIAAKAAEIGPIFLDTGKQRERPRIYIASKTAHAPRWRQLRADGLPVISTWIDEAGKGETACFTDLWQRCVDEAAAADAVIVYREPGEVLKGAFVEVGAALAVGTPVYAVGCDEFSFVHHAGVMRCADFGLALALALPTPPSDPAPSGQAEG